MGYKTVVVPDENIPIFTEQALDDKFKPEATWRTTFLTGKRSSEEIAGKVGELNSGILKVKTSVKLGEARDGIPVLIYASQKTIEEIKKWRAKVGEDATLMNIIFELRRGFYGGWSGHFVEDTFYECKTCGGYIKGRIEHKHSVEDMGGRAGNEDMEYKCIRCGETLDYKNLIHRD